MTFSIPIIFLHINSLVQVPEFNVYHVRAKDGFKLKSMMGFRTLRILSGKGKIGTFEVRAGDHLMLTSGTSYRIKGDLEWVMSDVPLPSLI